MATHYRSRLLVFALLVVTSAATLRPHMAAAAEPSGATQALFQDLIQQRLQAVARGDVAAYRRLLADEFVQISDSGVRRTVGDMPAFVASHSAASMAYTDIRAEVHGDVALVDSVLTQRDTFGTRELQTHYVVGDVYIRRDGRWLLRRHQETVKAVTPDRREPAAEVLNDYAGLYQWWPGFAERITLREGKLYVQDAKDPPEIAGAVLEAASDESFHIPGVPGLWFFARDRNGVVTHYVSQFMNGRVVVAKKHPGTASASP